MTVWAVVLAAGRGERLGGVAKALLRTGDLSFLAAVLAAAGDARALVVVGPPFGDAVAEEAARLGASVVVNPEPARGMASSVSLGFAALPAEASKALLWPVDHPFVSAATVRALLTADLDADVVVPRHHGRGGHPALVGPAVWPALVAGAPGGAREILGDPRWRRRDLAVDDPGVIRDVDTRDSLGT